MLNNYRVLGSSLATKCAMCGRLDPKFWRLWLRSRFLVCDLRHFQCLWVRSASIEDARPGDKAQHVRAAVCGVHTVTRFNIGASFIVRILMQVHYEGRNLKA